MIEVPEQIARDMCYFLGTDSNVPEELGYVTSLIKFAYADLLEKTGVNWLNSETEQRDTALEIVRSKVYLSYYGNRDDSKSTEHLERYIAAKTFALMYSQEAAAARGDKSGS